MFTKKLLSMLSAALLTLCLLATALPACLPTAEVEIADVVFFNGTVYTVDQDFGVAEAVAVKGNKILAVGAWDEVKKHSGEGTRSFDLDGKVLIPGLVDAHAHIFGYANSLDTLDLVGTTSTEEITALVARRIEEVGPGVWITGRGWDHNDWPEQVFPTHEVLDAVAPENPVVLTRIDGHANWANAKAMESGSVTKDTQDPPGGEIIRDGEGNPTGIFIDAAEGLVAGNIPPTPPELYKSLFEQAIKNCLAVGLVGIHDMSGGPRQIEIIKEKIDAGKFNFRIYFNLSAGLRNLDELLAQGHQNYGDGLLVVRSVKCFADGALGSRGAAMLEPYSDRPGSTGLIVTSEEQLTETAIKALKAGFQVSTHAIGDAGNRITLNAYEAALAAVPTEDHRLRIEHAQILSLEDIPRFAKLGILPSMQPTHCTSDLPWAIDRVGPERIKGAYAWRSLLDTGVIIPCGSDFPVERINPMLGIYAAVTRQHEDGTPEGGYFPEQRMTRQEALRGFTIWAAKAAFAEDWTGSIEAGKRADIVVLDRDIMKVAPNEILAAKVILTMVDGKIAYEQGK